MMRLILFIDLFLLLVVRIWSFSFLSMTVNQPTRVVVTGASNSVGFLVFKKLLKKKSFYPIGLVRDKKGFQNLIKAGASPDQIKICDIRYKETIVDIFEGVEKVVLCTTAKPKKTIKYVITEFIRKLLRQETVPQGSELYYPDKQTPYDVDFIGQKNAIGGCVCMLIFIVYYAVTFTVYA